MGRKNKGTAAAGKAKKDRNLFKVGDSKGRKKPKEVQVKLKKLKEAVKDKQEKVDATLKDLHKDMVVKKPQTPKQAPNTSSVKKGGGKTKNVQKKLGKMKV